MKNVDLFRYLCINRILANSKNLIIMDACLIYGCHYLDTAAYEPEDINEPIWREKYEQRVKEKGFTAYFDYSYQWEYDSKFKPTVIYNPLTLSPGKVSDGTSKRFLAVGRFSKQHKGFDLLIEAFHLFAQRNKEWKLDIVGEGVEEALYRSLIQKYGLEDRVIIHPFTNHVQVYYSNAQVYVLSSRWEGFGLVLVEAMAHGLPIVSSDLPTSKEIMGDFALYFKNGNIQELAQRLEDATHINWQAKSKDALEIAQRFDIHHIIEQWKQMIES